MDKTLKKDLIKAWERYFNDTYTRDDLAIVLDSIKNDDHIEEIKKVFNTEWNSYALPPTSEDRKEIYRKKAAQLLAEHQSIQQMQQRQISSRYNIVRFRKIWYAAAAAILLGLLIPAAYLYMKPKAEQTTVQYVEMDAQRGEIKTVVLSDQTKVTLNSGSRIVYPAIFTGAERSVELYGEALFDVTSDPARPFIVKTENMNIKVLGTVFDVKEYADDLTASVSVASGKVEVGLEKGKVMLTQNQQVKMDKATRNIETKNIESGNYLSWIDGALYFNRTPIREVVNMLNRLYPQVDIELEEGEYSNTITGEYNKDYQMENYLKGISYTTGLKYKKTGSKYTLYN